jgi:SAM-dependent methyltransferase
MRDVQVSPTHYAFERYDDLERWSSYWYQVRSALRLAPRSVLEIGSGTGVFGAYLRAAGVCVKSADIDDTRRPDYLADVANLDATLPAGVDFDVVCAFQVLEHLPFASFDDCLAGIARRARKFALISLPYNGLRIRFAFAFGPLRFAFGFRLPWPWRKRWDGQHHWELGVGYPIREITRRMSAHFDVVEHGVVPENPYHHLWILRSRT